MRQSREKKKFFDENREKLPNTRNILKRISFDDVCDENCNMDVILKAGVKYNA